MELDQVGADPLGHALDEGIVRVDQHGDRADLAAGDRREHAGFFNLDMARAPLEKHKPDIMGAFSRRRLDDGGRPHAADFDLDRHLLALGGEGLRALRLARRHPMPIRAPKSTAVQHGRYPTSPSWGGPT